MNSRSKGRRYENKAKATLEALGWSVELVKGGTGWQKSTDFFGWADIIAIHPEKSFVLLVQVKGGGRWYTPNKQERALIAQFGGLQAPIKKEWWMFRDRIKEPRILEL